MNNENAALLKKYLSRYYRAKERKKILQKRLAEISRELEHPSIGSRPPESSQPDHNENQGAASLVFRKAEIEDRIQRQQEHEAKIITDIMDVLECLPLGSIERDIMEYRHLDCMRWGDISKMVHLTRTPCYSRYCRGLEILLQQETVQRKLAEYREAPEI
ncbi:MAG: hypothetical protein ACI4JC_01155 [Faecalibacterium sp.]